MGMTGFDGARDTNKAIRVTDYSQTNINDNFMDNTADANSDALWAEFDALEAALV